jgi:DNA-binding beta-propeller fold protein YncE
MQAHAAVPAPNGRYAVVANQNGKLLQRIQTDYATNTFTLDAAATVNLADCTTPHGHPCQAASLRPDNAPVCPIIDTTNRLTFVTLRGGGLFVVDAAATPMRIIAEYDQATVGPNGCGGLEKDGKLYLNAGGGTAASPTEAALYVFDLDAFRDENRPNEPAPKRIFAREGDHDSHGMLLNAKRQGRYLWVADRFSNAIEVVDTTTDRLVNTFSLVGKHSADPAPDLMEVSPNGKYAFVTLRGPCPLSANAPSVNNAVGATPGLGVVAVKANGRDGKLVAIAPIRNPGAPFACNAVGGTPTLTERADVHGIAIRFRLDHRAHD